MSSAEGGAAGSEAAFYLLGLTVWLTAVVHEPGAVSFLGGIDDLKRDKKCREKAHSLGWEKAHSLRWEKAANTTLVGITSFPTLFWIFPTLILGTGICQDIKSPEKEHLGTWLLIFQSSPAGCRSWILFLIQP